MYVGCGAAADTTRSQNPCTSCQVGEGTGTGRKGGRRGFKRHVHPRARPVHCQERNTDRCCVFPKDKLPLSSGAVQQISFGATNSDVLQFNFAARHGHAVGEHSFLCSATPRNTPKRLQGRPPLPWRCNKTHLCRCRRWGSCHGSERSSIGRLVARWGPTMTTSATRTGIRLGCSRTPL